MGSRCGWLVAVLWAVAGFGQTQEPAPAPAAGTQPAADLSTRYRFRERYAKSSEKGEAEEIGQYRVATRETMKIVSELAQGAPERQESTEQTIYSERPAELGSAGKVQAAVRRYATYRRTTEAAGKPSPSRPLEGLTVWYEARDEGEPKVVSLTEGRGLRADEYLTMVRQVFVPEIATVLPSLPVRVGDRWTVSKEGMQVLLGLSPARGEPLAGTLVEVHKAARGPNWEAIINVSGRARLSHGDTAVNARLTFAFAPPPETANKAGDDADPMDAHGAVTELRMASTSVAPQGPNSRLRQIVTRELVLARELGDQGGALTVPASPPEATEENSWLTYEDLQGKFHFHYPQDFRTLRPPDEFSVELLRPRTGGPDILEIILIIKTGDAEADRLNRDPTFQLKMVKDELQESGYSVITGVQKWLPEADWASLKRKVFRAEQVALRKAKAVGKKDTRVHSDLYLVLFGRDESLIVKTMTIQDPSTPYRQQVEAVLRSFDFGPVKAAAK